MEEVAEIGGQGSERVVGEKTVSAAYCLKKDGGEGKEERERQGRLECKRYLEMLLGREGNTFKEGG